MQKYVFCANRLGKCLDDCVIYTAKQRGFCDNFVSKRPKNLLRLLAEKVLELYTEAHVVKLYRGVLTTKMTFTFIGKS